MSKCLRLAMPKAAIVVGAEVATASATTRSVEALQKAIAETNSEIQVEVCLSSELNSLAIASDEVILCPLTLEIPSYFAFPAQKIYQVCRDVLGTRQWVQEKLGVSVGNGNFWLPVIWTAKGPLYAEAIGVQELEANSPTTNYCQPVHLSDAKRQSLYQLAYRLLTFLGAIPATYLMQFGFDGEEIYFDRLWPFPAEPAIASLGLQVPDLFTCHWHCLTKSPIYDLQISSFVDLKQSAQLA